VRIFSCAAMPMEGTYKTKSGTKAGTQSLPTPMPMSVNASTVAEINGPPDYKDQVNGIIPGYSGHMPRARDKYAASAHGSVAPKFGPHNSIGPQTGHVRPEDVIPPRFDSYMRTAQGTVPGYTGWRPEAAHVKNVSAWGCVPHERGNGYETPNVGLSATVGSLADPSKPADHTEQGVRQYDWRRKNKQAEPPPSFRDNVGGVLPGYAGHVPRSDEKHGTSHYGGLAPDKMYVPLAQTGHEGYKIDPMSGQAGEVDVELKMIPNYQGFIPKARDAFGTSFYTKGK